MKGQVFGAFTMLTLFVTLAVPATNAQSTGEIVAKVPFEFLAGNTTLPAGEYLVTPIGPASVGSVLMIRNVNRRASVMVLTAAVQANVIRANSRLAFNRYGERYFLSRVWLPHSSVGRALLPSRDEMELAKNTTESQTVFIVGWQK